VPIAVLSLAFATLWLAAQHVLPLTPPGAAPAP